MKTGYYFFLGWKQSRRRRKRSGHGMTLLVISVVAILFSHSISGSLSHFINSYFDNVRGREIEFPTMRPETGTGVYELLEETYQNDSRVDMIYMDQEISGFNTSDLTYGGGNMRRMGGWLDPYIIEKIEMREGEYGIIIPVYLSDGDVDAPFATAYQDGRDLLGKEIAVTDDSYSQVKVSDADAILANPGAMEDRFWFDHYSVLVDLGVTEANVRIVGVYDNIALGVTGLDAYFYDVDGKLCALIEEESDKRLIRYKELVDESNEKIGKIVDAIQNEAGAMDITLQASGRAYTSELVDEINKLLEEKGISARCYQVIQQSGSPILGILQYILPLCSYILFALAVISLIVESGQDAAGEKGILGMQAALGYRKKDLLIIRIIELLIRVAKTILPCLLVYLAAAFAVNTFIRYRMNPLWISLSVNINVWFLLVLFLIMAAAYVLTDGGMTLCLTREEPERLLTER